MLCPIIVEVVYVVQNRNGVLFSVFFSQRDANRYRETLERIAEKNNAAQPYFVVAHMLWGDRPHYAKGEDRIDESQDQSS